VNKPCPQHRGPKGILTGDARLSRPWGQHLHRRLHRRTRWWSAVLLVGDLPRAILRRLHQIAEPIQPLGARVVVNTIYDPSDGDNEAGRREMGLSRFAAIELRRRLNAVNGIVKLALERGFLLADLEQLFHGHGFASKEPWFVNVIEPNLAGATAIAERWYALLTSDPVRRSTP
jgi:hypothetical protein